MNKPMVKRVLRFDPPRRAHRPELVAGLVACLVLLGSPWRMAEAEPRIKGSVYFGNPQSYEEPAQISIVKVFEAILRTLPGGREVIEGKINKDDPRYWLMMRRVDKIFKAALKAMNKKYGYDLIGELKFLDTGEDVPDITAEMILRIKKKRKKK